MNFKEEYDRIINQAKLESRNKNSSIYYEWHHIIPKSFGGSNSKENLVLLTAQEHYMAHYYLWKYYKTGKMAMAFWRMNISPKKGVKIISPDEFAELRKIAAEESRKRQSKPVYCLELDMDFPSCKEATKFVTGDYKNSQYIGQVCNKQHKTVFIWKGNLKYHWCWLNEKEEFKKHKEELLYEEAHKQEIINAKISQTKKLNPTTPMKGKQHTEETKKKISEANKGKPGYFKGKHLSDETKRKLSEAHLGKTSWNKGKHLSEETKRKLSEKQSIKVKCVELNKIFNSGKEAAEYFGFCSGFYILDCARKNKIYKGYHWEIVD